MPIKTTYDYWAGVIVYKVIGEISVDDIIEVAGKKFSDPRFSPKMSILWDLTRGTISGLDSKDMRILARSASDAWKKVGGPDKIAIVAEQNIDFGLSRMYSTYAEYYSIDLRVFRSATDAKKWLFDRSSKVTY